MKTSILWLAVLVIVAGCQKSVKQEDNGTSSATNISAIWECNQKVHWKFTLLEDGTLSEVDRSDAQHMVIAEGGLIKEAENFILRYVFGPCFWTYDKKSNVLYVCVTIDDFYVKAGPSEINCTLIDEFKGLLSPDGKTWEAEWTTTMKYDQSISDRVENNGKLTFHLIQ